MPTQKILAVPSIRRLPLYLHVIKQAQREHFDFISGTYIARELDLEPIQVRKDLAITGIAGKPKRGYPVQVLISAIEHFLDWDSTKTAVIIGAGNLGTALTGYQEFQYHGLHFAAAFDIQSEKTGTSIHGVPVFSMEVLSEMIKNLKATIAVLTVPSAHAQTIADSLIQAGIRAIWNFTNSKLKVPEHIAVQQEDLTSGFAMLCVKMASIQPSKVKE